MKDYITFVVLMFSWAFIGLLLGSAGVPDILALILAMGILYAICVVIGKLRK